MIILIIVILLIGGVVNVSFADRAAFEKSTNKLIEFQTGNAPLGTLTKNAVSAGYSEDEVEEKYITQDEYVIIRDKYLNPQPTEADEIAKAKDQLLKNVQQLNKLKTLAEKDPELKKLIEDAENDQSGLLLASLGASLAALGASGFQMRKKNG